MDTDYEPWAWKILGPHTAKTLTPLTERIDVQAAIQRSLEEREALFQRLNGLYSLADYWQLPEAEKNLLRTKKERL